MAEGPLCKAGREHQDSSSETDNSPRNIVAPGKPAVPQRGPPKITENTGTSTDNCDYFSEHAVEDQEEYRNDLVNGSDAYESLYSTHLRVKHANEPDTEIRGAPRQIVLVITPLSRLYELRGEMEFGVDEGGFSFYDIKTQTVICNFPHAWIKTCSPPDNITRRFYFDLGPKCPAGEGRIEFTTQDCAGLYKEIKRMWTILSKKR